MADKMASGFDWRQIAAAKQQQRQADIDAFVADQDPALTDRITAIDDTVVLARMLAEGGLPSKDVTRAYITR